MIEPYLPPMCLFLQLCMYTVALLLPLVARNALLLFNFRPCNCHAALEKPQLFFKLASSRLSFPTSITTRT